MNDFERQTVLLFALMAFLSAVTVFFVTVSNSEPADNTQEPPETSEGGLLGGFKLTRSEGDGLVSQSINGLIKLNEDIGIGLNVISGNVTESKDNTSLEETS